MDWVRNNEKIGSNRMRFILECLKDLDATLKQMGTRLFVLRGDSTTVIRKFCRGNFYDLLSYNYNSHFWVGLGTYFQKNSRLWNHANDLDEGCRSILSPAWSRNKNNRCSAGDRYEIFWWTNLIQSWRKFRWLQSMIHTRDLFPWLIDSLGIQDINDSNGGGTPLSKKQFDKAIEKLGCPGPPLPTPTKDMFKQVACDIQPDHKTQFGIPTLTQLGFEEGKIFFLSDPT